MRKDNKIYVCNSCGKTSINKYGTLTHGWDVSCYLNSMLIDKDRLVYGKNGRVEKVLTEKELLEKKDKE